MQNVLTKEDNFVIIICITTYIRYFFQQNRSFHQLIVENRVKSDSIFFILLYPNKIKFF